MHIYALLMYNYTCITRGKYKINMQWLIGHYPFELYIDKLSSI